jgi:arylsulfatase A-like enzyme
MVMVLEKFGIYDHVRKSVKKIKVPLVLLIWIGLFVVSLFFPNPSVLSWKKGRDINVVLVVIDALRADHLGCYGYPLPTSPFIDKLAKNGAIFLNTLAQWPTSTPSHASLLTSTYPHTHECFPNGAFLRGQFITIAEILKKYGYSTAAFIRNPLISRLNNFDQGFNSFYSHKSHYFKNMTFKYILHNINLVKILDRVLNPNRNYITMFSLDWLEENRAEKFFLFLQYFAPHSPYKSHAGFEFLGNNYKVENKLVDEERKEEFSAKQIKEYLSFYDSEIGYVDSEINKIVKKLEELDILDNTLIIITADHGENLNSHKPYFRHADLYDSSIKIPLIFYFSEYLMPIEISGCVESIDVVPTILEFLEIPSIKQFQGKSLFPYMTGSEPEPPLVGYSEEIDPVIRRVCSRTSEWKFILEFQKDEIYEELYNVKNDPAERQAISDNPKMSEIQREQLVQWIKQSDKAVNYFLRFVDFKEKKYSKETLKILRSLGYIK